MTKQDKYRTPENITRQGNVSFEDQYLPHLFTRLIFELRTKTSTTKTPSALLSNLKPTTLVVCFQC